MLQKKSVDMHLHIVRDLRLFFGLFILLIGGLIGAYYYDVSRPFINTMAERFFNFLLQ